MNVSDRQILNYVKSRPKPLKRKKIAKALKVKGGEEYQRFKDLLLELERKGKLVRLKKGRYSLPGKANMVVGHLTVNPGGFGFVVPENGGPDVYINHSKMGPGLHGDKVLVKVCKKARLGDSPEGEIVQVLERNLTSVVGTYWQNKSFGFIRPDDPKITKDIYVSRGGEMGAKEGQKVVARVEELGGSNQVPQSEITEILGYPEEPGMDVLSIIKAYELPLKFPPEVLKEVEEISDGITSWEIKRRKDLRGVRCFTIDPQDAKDFDDAVSIETVENRNFLLGVHIADVSHYVPAASFLDQEALNRGRSVYLVDRAIPMLPEKLSGKLCSLRPGEEKLALSLLVEINKAGEVINYQLAESVIKSDARLTYQQAQDILEGKEDGKLAEELYIMGELAEILSKKRRQRGSLDFDLPEAKVVLDENGIPLEIYPRKRLQSHKIIEEFMIIANKVVAEHAHRLSLPILYRVHDKPDLAKLEEFAELVKSLGYSFHIKKDLNPKGLQRLLGKMEGRNQEGIVNELLLKAMKRAVYSPDNIGHFGLALDFYTHFTSPIRRYPDLLVHRVLKKANKGEISQERRRALKRRAHQVGEIASEREIIADKAEWDSIKVKQMKFIEQRIGQPFWGVISEVCPIGFFVQLEKSLVEGLVHVNTLKGDFYKFNRKNYSLVGKRNKKTFKIGDRVKVRVVQVDKNLEQIDFKLV